MKRTFVLAVALIISAFPLARGGPMGTAFTYQGCLSDGAAVANGQYDLEFALFDAAAGGSQIGGTLFFSPVSVRDGMFTAPLDFGAAAFAGEARWLQIGVRPSGPGPVHPAYTLLTPRQPVTPSPYALHAATAQTLTGTIDATAATLNFGNSVRQLLSFWGSAYGLGVQADTLYFRSDTGFAWYQDGTHANGQFDPGANGKTLMKLTGAGTLELKSDSTIPNPHLRLVETQAGDYARLEFQSSARPFWHVAVGGAANQMNFYNSTNGDVMTLKENGELLVKVLTVTGGADVAEPFPMSKPEVAKGAVVVIDDEHPGQLRVSDRAYDTRVAGVVSGANGVRPGLSLSQQGVLEGTQQVALTGRVYVQADATPAPIKPGDLLTTSDRPGYAMRVTDHARAQGAILGKAMTGLKEGNGLVLVLVTLQ